MHHIAHMHPVLLFLLSNEFHKQKRICEKTSWNIYTIATLDSTASAIANFAFTCIQTTDTMRIEVFSCKFSYNNFKWTTPDPNGIEFKRAPKYRTSWKFVDLLKIPISFFLRVTTQGGSGGFLTKSIYTEATATNEDSGNLRLWFKIFRYFVVGKENPMSDIAEMSHPLRIASDAEHELCGKLWPTVSICQIAVLSIAET